MLLDLNLHVFSENDYTKIRILSELTKAISKDIKKNSFTNLI